MTPERWQEVKDVLNGALELAPEQRSAFLDKAWSQDPSLRQDVESLLASSDQARSSFLQSSAVRVALTKGTQLGDYEVQSLLGSGGMGEVYRARDRRLDRDVAIKVLPSFLSSDPDRLRRFEQEARAAAALNHPNIVAVLLMGTHQGAPYLVSELLEGLTLREHLQRGPLPIKKVTDYAIQMAHGLAAAHDKGIVHRDLKPENLFVTTDGRVKILDFGLAKLTQPKADPIATVRTLDEPTEPGVVMGTVGYMSPEQVRGEVVDHRTDIFAFGVILYEMLSHKRAFQGANAVETMGAILKDEPPSITDIVPAIPAGLQRILQHCLEKNPEQRLRSAWDLAFELKSLSDVGTSPLVSIQRAKARTGMSWLLAAVLFALLIAIPWGIAYFHRTPRPERAMHFSISLPSSVRDLALSPDGRTLAFIAPPPNGGGNVLWTREVGSVETHVLANTEGASYPFWSPDARSIGFFADGKLKRIEAADGPVQILTDAPFGRGGAWGNEGTIIFAANPTEALARISATGGLPTPITNLPRGAANFANLSHRWPFFLPDGKHFLYSMADFTGLRGEANAIYLGTLDSKEQRRLVPSNSNAAYLPPGYLIFSRNQTLMAQRFDANHLQLIGEPFAVANDTDYVSIVARAIFSVSQNGTLVYQTGSSTSSQLQWFDRSGKQLSTIGAPARYANPRISPDGRKVAVDIDDPESNTAVWLVNLENGVRSRFTFDSSSAEETPIWSPDGARVLWMSQRNGGINFYMKAATGSGSEEPITRSSVTLLDLPTDWSRDGRFLLYTATRPDWNLQMSILPLKGDGKPRAFAHSQSSEREGQFSPDGRWVAYSSNESGRSQVYVVPFPGPGGKYQISTEGGQQPRWRRDGKELFFLSPGKKLMAVSIRAGANLEFGEPTVLFQTRAREPLSSEEVFTYDVSPEGQRFLINENLEQANPPPVNIVLNWTSELQR
jgi:Tol biopolymer transport system component